MGVVNSITANLFPKQGSHLNKRVNIKFHYFNPSISGIVVRDDIEEPYVTIIKLDSGIYILATECQYSIQD